MKLKYVAIINTDAMHFCGTLVQVYWSNDMMRLSIYRTWLFSGSVPQWQPKINKLVQMYCTCTITVSKCYNYTDWTTSGFFTC